MAPNGAHAFPAPISQTPLIVGKPSEIYGLAATSFEGHLFGKTNLGIGLAAAGVSARGPYLKQWLCFVIFDDSWTGSL